MPSQLAGQPADVAIPQLVEQHGGQLKVWVDEYVTVNGGAPLFTKRKRRARVAVGSVPDHTPTLSHEEADARLHVPGIDEGDDLGTSLVLMSPEGAVMFGILNAPFTLGEA